MTRTTVIEQSQLLMDRLAALSERPPLFAPGEPQFWTDPHIAQEMLKAHLDPNTEAASRRPDVIVAIVDWLIAQLGLSPGDAWLDLGCGPGLYCRQLAERGLAVTGVDFSKNSIAYARAHDPASTYHVQDYRELDVPAGYHTVSLIYGDFCVLPDADRDRLLGNIHRALRPDGYFVFDVTTPAMHERLGTVRSWEANNGPGFWRPGPHLMLMERFLYPDELVRLDQYLVIEPGGATTQYRVWDRAYTPETVTALLTAHGFSVVGVYGDLAGAPWTAASEWMGVIAQKV